MKAIAIVALATVVLGIGVPRPVTTSGMQPLPQPRDRGGVAVTNAEGRFVFRDVPAGELSLTVDRERYAPGRSSWSSARARPSGWI